MNKTMIHARIDPVLKDDVQKIFEKLGISLTEAITMFFSHVKMYRGFPFELRIPNKTTLQAMRDVEEGRNLKTFDSTEEMFKYLNSDDE